jgi:hypothetical protein
MQPGIVLRVAGVEHRLLQPGKKRVVVVINAIFLSSERKRVIWKDPGAGAIKAGEPGDTPAPLRGKKIRKGYHEVLEG